MKTLALAVALALCSCSAKSPPKDYHGDRSPGNGASPTDVVYVVRQSHGSGDAVPIQIFRLRSGATFLVIGTDTHGTPIVYTHNAEGWTLADVPRGGDAK